MSRPNPVWVEVDATKTAIRIFKNVKAAAQSLAWNAGLVGTLEYRIAVTQIRRKIWERDKHKCTHCGANVPWGVFEMHEIRWRGRGGEISLDNGTTLCTPCHQDDPVAGHGERKVMWQNHQ